MQTGLPLTLGVAQPDPACIHRGASCQFSCRWSLSSRVKLAGTTPLAVTCASLLCLASPCCVFLSVVLGTSHPFLPAHHTSDHGLPGLQLAVVLRMWCWCCHLFKGYGQRERVTLSFTTLRDWQRLVQDPAAVGGPMPAYYSHGTLVAGAAWARMSFDDSCPTWGTILKFGGQ